MKKVLLMLMLAGSFTVHARALLSVSFKSEQDKKVWKEWFLDKNGEDLTGFYATSWGDDYIDLRKDPSRRPNLNILDKKVKISDFIKVKCQDSIHLNPAACYESVVNCIDYMNSARILLTNTPFERELIILGQCISLE